MSESSEGRRSGFLVFAVFLANAFLVMLAIDALVSIADDVVLRSGTDSAFYGVRSVLALLALGLGLVALFLVIFVPPLPKLVLLPPVLVEFWLAFGAVPIAWSLTDPTSMARLSAIQLAAAAIAFVMCRVTTGHWFIAASRLPRKGHLVLRTLLAIPISLVVAGLLVAGSAVGILVFFVQEQTKGYLQFTSSGIEVRETVMRKDDDVVHLVATVHLADPQFYRDVYSAIPRDALILAEGVTDRKGLMRSGLSYGNAAQALGLETQGVLEKLMGPATEEPTPDAKAGGPANAPGPAPTEHTLPTAPKVRPDVVRADVDVADFSPLTLRFIGRVGEFYSSRNFSEAMDRLTAVSGEFSEADVKVVMDDLIHKRNEKVLAELDKRLPQYATVFIPWGAQHMPGLEASLKERGFSIVSQRMIPLARYQTIYDAFLAQKRRAEVGGRVLADGAP